MSAKGESVREVLGTVSEVAQSEEFEQFRMRAEDFLSARDAGGSPSTQIAQMTSSIGEAAEILNRSFSKEERGGQRTNVISPVVIPRDSRSYWWVLVVLFLAGFGIFGLTFSSAFDRLVRITDLSTTLFGPHFCLLLVGYIGFNLWRNSFVMIPDGCQALITKFGKLEETVGSGRTWLLDPRKKVSYVVNTTKEYPYNAPIREAPTASRVNASVDLFLQFRIEDPAEFIFTLGGTSGFSEKLQNAVSEVTRALIYEQNAEDIYDLVGENTQGLLESLNKQFMPAVQFVNASITHAEPSEQEYRMDLASPEMARVAKEAYTDKYGLKLRKEQDEGELNKELASLREKLSDIRAKIAEYQAQIDTAHEKEVNRANAYARQLLSEAESEARANAALLEAQALDIRAVNAASYPEVLEYRWQQATFDNLAAVADRLPRVVSVGPTADEEVDFMAIAKRVMGIRDEPLYTDDDLMRIREHRDEIVQRIKSRAERIRELAEEGEMEQMRPGEAEMLELEEEIVA